MSDTHPIENLDDTVHQRHRLGILVILRESGRADFTYLRDTLNLTDGNLGQHLEVLRGASLVKLEKVRDARRPRTVATIMAKGRRALAKELSILETLVQHNKRHIGSI